MLNSNNSYFNNIIPILLRIYSTTSFQNIQNLTKKQTNSLLSNISTKLLDWFYQEIWPICNISQHQWEQARNITSKSKQTKLALSILPNQTNNQTIPLQIPDSIPVIRK